MGLFSHHDNKEDFDRPPSYQPPAPGPYGQQLQPSYEQKSPAPYGQGPYGQEPGAYGQHYSQNPQPAYGHPGDEEPPYGQQSPNQQPAYGAQHQYGPSQPSWQPQIPQQQQSYGAPPQAQQWPQPPQQQHAPQPIQFKFTHGSVLDSQVTDPWGRVVMTFATHKKTTTVMNGQGNQIATVEWGHTSPRLIWRGKTIKIREWMPYNRKRKARAMIQRDEDFDWVDQRHGVVALLKRTNPSTPFATFSNEHKTTVLTMYPDAFVRDMLEQNLLAVFLMSSGKPFGDNDHGISSGIMAAIVVANNS